MDLTPNARARGRSHHVAFSLLSLWRSAQDCSERVVLAHPERLAAVYQVFARYQKRLTPVSALVLDKLIPKLSSQCATGCVCKRADVDCVSE